MRERKANRGWYLHESFYQAGPGAANRKQTPIGLSNVQYEVLSGFLIPMAGSNLPWERCTASPADAITFLHELALNAFNKNAIERIYRMLERKTVRILRQYVAACAEQFRIVINRDLEDVHRTWGLRGVIIFITYLSVILASIPVPVWHRHLASNVRRALGFGVEEVQMKFAKMNPSRFIATTRRNNSLSPKMVEVAC